MDEQTERTHPSYALISFSRITGDTDLFGSDIRHRGFIRLEIKAATEIRNLHHTWYYGHKPTVCVDMSHAQFAELITTMNAGMGTPCTLKYLKDEKIPNPPSFESEVKVVEKEFKSDVRKVTQQLVDLQKSADELLKKPTLNKADRENIRAQIQAIVRDVRENLPFIVESFGEAMEKTVTNSKTEVDAFVTTAIHKLGIEKLEDLISTQKQIEG